MDDPLAPRLLLNVDGAGRALYQGPLRIRRGDSVADADGELQFVWRPSPWIRYVCTFGDGIPGALDPFVPGEVSVELVGPALIPAGDLPVAREPDEFAANGSYHSDRMPRGYMFGSASDEVQMAEFHLVNGPNVVPPKPLRRADGSGAYRGRFHLYGQIWKITLDAHPDISLDDYVRHLAEQRAFGPTHIGLLERADGRLFDADFAREGLDLLFTTLSFCRGALTGPSLPMGIDEDGSARWLSLETLLADEWEGRFSWCDRLMGSSIESVFARFEACWLDTFRREVLSRVVRYYVEANSAPVEKGLILGQAALELLSWAVLVELQGTQTRANLKGRAAKDNVRDLLRWAGINLDISDPRVAHKFAGLMSAYPEADRDGPALTTWARNRIAHPERDVPSLQGAPLVNAWQLTLFYLELVILRFVEYHGVFSNRLTSQWTGEHERVPWD